jgi:hypothetical protein
MNTVKRLTIIIDRQTANVFLSRCKAQNTNGSEKIRKWIEEFLEGEKA